MERVLGNDALAQARQHNRFEYRTGDRAPGTTVTSIEVHLFDRYHDER